MLKLSFFWHRSTPLKRPLIDSNLIHPTHCQKPQPKFNKRTSSRIVLEESTFIQREWIEKLSLSNDQKSLFDACKCGDIETTKKFINKGCNVETPYFAPDTILNHPEIAKIFIHPFTPPYTILCASLPFPNLLRYLVTEAQVDVKAYGDIALFIATLTNNSEAVEFLLENGAGLRKGPLDPVQIGIQVEAREAVFVLLKKENSSFPVDSFKPGWVLEFLKGLEKAAWGVESIQSSNSGSRVMLKSLGGSPAISNATISEFSGSPFLEFVGSAGTNNYEEDYWEFP